MRELRLAAITVSLLAVVVIVAAGIVFGPSLLFLPAERQSKKDERAARELIARQVDTYAAQVVSHSTAPAGPSAAALTELSDQASLRYATERSGGALIALWVEGTGQAGAIFGPYGVYECYRIRFHDLGTPGAGDQVTHLPDCKESITRLDAQLPTPRSTATSRR